MTAGCICVVGIHIETARGMLWQTHLVHGQFVPLWSPSQIFFFPLNRHEVHQNVSYAFLGAI